jgi:hypothetical protein
MAANYCTPESFDPKRIIVKAPETKTVKLPDGQQVTYSEMNIQYNYSSDSTIRPGPLLVQLGTSTSPGIQKSKFGKNKYQMRIDFFDEKPEDKLFVSKLEEARELMNIEVKKYFGGKRDLTEILYYPKDSYKLPIKEGWKRVSLYPRMRCYTEKETQKFVMMSKFLRVVVDDLGKTVSSPIDDWTCLSFEKARITHRPLISLAKINITNTGNTVKAEHVSSIVKNLKPPTQNEIQEALIGMEEFNEEDLENARAMDAFLADSSKIPPPPKAKSKEEMIFGSAPGITETLRSLPGGKEGSSTFETPLSVVETASSSVIRGPPPLPGHPPLPSLTPK